MGIWHFFNNLRVLHWDIIIGVGLLALAVICLGILMFEDYKFCNPHRVYFEEACEDFCSSRSMNYSEYNYNLQNFNTCVLKSCTCSHRDCGVDEDFNGYRVTQDCRTFYEIYNLEAI